MHTLSLMHLLPENIRMSVVHKRNLGHNFGENPLKSGFRVKILIIQFIENNISEGLSSGFCNNLNTQLDIKGTKTLFIKFFK